MKYLTTRLHHPHTQKRGADLFCPRTSILLFRVWVQLRGLSAWWAEHVRQGNNIWQDRTEETRGWPRVHGQKAGQLVGIYHMWEGWRPSGASQPLSGHIKTRLWEDKVSSWLLLSRQSLNLLWTQPNTRDIMHKSHRLARNHADTGLPLWLEIEHTHGSSIHDTWRDSGFTFIYYIISSSDWVCVLITGQLTFARRMFVWRFCTVQHLQKA